jgi:nitric oxide dioxygenase
MTHTPLVPSSDTRPGSIRRHPLSEPLAQDEPVCAVDQEMIGALRTSFALLQPLGGELTSRFYAALFEAYPHLRPMFPSDMSAQREKLVKSLEMVLEGLDHPAMVRARLKELGELHTSKGARPEHYPIVCRLLTQTMAGLLGPQWTPELERDWNSALEQISRLMIG